MAFLKHTLDFYLKSSIHVALAVVALSVLNGLFLNKTPDLNLLLFQFTSTIFYYNSLKYGQLLLKGTLRQLWFTVALWILTLLSLVVSLYTLFQFSLLQLLMMGIALVLGLSYVFLPSSVFGRENGTLKTLTVALVWAIVTSALHNQGFKFYFG
jgi:predicted membrane protein